MTDLVADIFDRLALYAESNTDVAIGKLLGISRQAIANARKRNVPPFEKICNFAIDNELSLDYLLQGKELKDESFSPVSFDEDLLNYIIVDFELNYKTEVEDNKAAEWVWTRDVAPEELDNLTKPTKDEFESLSKDICEKGLVFDMIIKIYNQAIIEQDKTEQEKIIKYQTLLSAAFVKKPHMAKIAAQKAKKMVQELMEKKGK